MGGVNSFAEHWAVIKGSEARDASSRVLQYSKVRVSVFYILQYGKVRVSVLQFGGMGECGNHYCRLGWEGRRPVYYTFSAALQFASANQ